MKEKGEDINKTSSKGVINMGRKMDALELKESYQKGERDFSGISLKGEELIEADFRGANFEGADFKGAKLDKVCFNSVSLREADFTGAKIVEVEFSAADLSGARFPNGFSERFNDTLDIIKDVAKNLQKICLGLIAISLYIGFTLSHIKDQDLFIKHTPIELPIVGVNISSLPFLFSAQLIILAIFLYFQVYRKHLTELIDKLPSRFLDGIGRECKLHPWVLFMQMTRVKQEQLKSNSIYSSVWFRLISGFFYWLFVPIISGSILLRTLNNQSEWLYIAAGVGFLATCFLTCTSNNWIKREDGKILPNLVGKKALICLSALLVFGSTLIYIGIKENWFPMNLEKAHLAEMNLKKYDFKGANLNDANLEKAILREVDFRCATMERAKCSGANFSDARLDGAYLNFAKLMKTISISAKFKRASLIRADLSDANFLAADFSGANLIFADFSGADLKDAIFDGACIMSAKLKKVKNLSIEQLAKAETLYCSQLDKDLEEQMRNRYPHLLEKPKYKER